MSDLTYRAYERTARRVGDVTVVHGRYDGLATEPVAHAHGQLFIPLAGRAHVAPAIAGGAGAASGAEVGKGVVIGPEAAAWIPAGLAHAASSLGAVVAFVALNVPADWAAALAAAHGLPVPRPGLLVLPEPGLWLAARLLADSLTDPPGGDAYVEAAIRQIGLLAARAAGGPAPRAATEAGVQRAIDRALRSYAAPLTVADLAREAGLGVRQLERRFADAVGMAPRRFLINVRLAAARELLGTTSLTVEAIAERVGFADTTHFTRAFRAAHGTTPAAWRRARGADLNP